MPKEELLDTWFLQLDKKDSPVMHQVVYQVKDSIGNITEVPCKVKIKYNEFPVIEAQDRLFYASGGAKWKNHGRSIKRSGNF